MTISHFHIGHALEDLGLAPYAARVYLSLALVARATAARVAEDAGVPRQRVYDVLESLMLQGLVCKSRDKPALFFAADPLDACAILLGAHRTSMARLETVAAGVVSELRQPWLTARAENHDRGGSTSGLGRIGPARMELWRDYATRVVLATARPPFDGLDDSAWIQRVKNLTRAGGVVRCVYHCDLLESPALIKKAAAYAAAGEEARIADTVETRMILTDSTRALLAIAPADPEAAPGPVLLIDDANTVERLEEVFLRLWDQAKPFIAQP